MLHRIWPGLYAAGDILMHDGKLHLIARAFNDGGKCGQQSKTIVTPKATKTAMVSSHNEMLIERNEKLVQKLLM